MGLLTSSGTTATPKSVDQVAVGKAAQPYAADVLAKGAAMVQNPTPAYTGQLTAGTSDLQSQAWQGLSNLTLPSTLTTAGSNLLDIGNKNLGVNYNPVGETFTAEQAQQYMNPYLMAALNPQLDEARRQSLITQMGNAAKATSQGAFGGTRQALMDTETQRALGTNLANITGAGYKDAYDKAMNQFNEEQKRKIQEAQYGTDTGLKGLSQAATANQAAATAGTQQAQYGLENLKALSTVGNTQQAQEQAGLNALYNQYLDQRSFPWKQLSDQSALIKSLGGTDTAKYGAEMSDLQKAVGITGSGAELMQNLKAAGMSSESIAKALKAVGINPETLSANIINTPDQNSMTAGGTEEGNQPAYDSSGTYIGYYDKNGVFHEID